MEETLISGIQLSLANRLYDNATFLAERLVAQNKSEQNIYFLGTCFYETKKYLKTFQLLKESTLPTSRYLCALSASQLGKFVEAQRLLLPPTSAENLDNVANGAAGLYLLGTILTYELFFSYVDLRQTA
jgi:anaphase-promoting complex subunit 3